MDNWVIEPLSAAHQRAEFCCGKSSLDAFLQSHVSQYEKRRLGRTYVAVLPAEQRVWGYFTLAASAVAYAHLPAKAAKKLPRHPVPVILLARLAVDQAMRGKGLGRLLLADALRRCASLASSLGVHAVEVDALDDAAKAFYEKYGFTALEDNPLHLFLPIAAIDQALGPSAASP